MIDDFGVACSTLSVIEIGPPNNPYTTEELCNYAATFRFPRSISGLFPFLNSLLPSAQLNRNPDFIRFNYKQRLCLLQEHEAVFAPAHSLQEARGFVEELLNLLDEVKKKQKKLVPNFRPYSPASAVDIYKLLPGNNCGECNFRSCTAFAAAVARQHSVLANCPYAAAPIQEQSTFEVAGKDGTSETISLPVDSTQLTQLVQDQEAYIQNLQDQLKSLRNSSQGVKQTANETLLTPLTKRELEVLTMIAQGLTNKEISQKLFISVHTVKTHVNHIFDKLGVNDRTQASVWAAKHGLA